LTGWPTGPARTATRSAAARAGSRRARRRARRRALDQPGIDRLEGEREARQRVGEQVDPQKAQRRDQPAARERRAAARTVTAAGVDHAGSAPAGGRPRDRYGLPRFPARVGWSPSAPRPSSGPRPTSTSSASSTPAASPSTDAARPGQNVGDLLTLHHCVYQRDSDSPCTRSARFERGDSNPTR